MYRITQYCCHPCSVIWFCLVVYGCVWLCMLIGVCNANCEDFVVLKFNDSQICLYVFTYLCINFISLQIFISYRLLLWCSYYPFTISCNCKLSVYAFNFTVILGFLSLRVGEHFLALIKGTGSIMYVIGDQILCGRVEDGY
jgi:hypothetical protein